MSTVNRVVLIGNAGRDADAASMPSSGNPLVRLSLATSDRWRDKATGEMRELTEWHRAVVFGDRLTERARAVTKGAKVYLAGRLRTRKWQDRDGNDRYTTEIIVDAKNGELQVLSARGGGGAAPRAEPDDERQATESRRTASAAATNDNFDDDIPF